MKVLCLNDQNRPNEIPTSKWVKLGEEYTVTKLMKCNVQGGLLGFQLAGIDLTGCEPYLFFSANRFSLPVDDLVSTEELEEEFVS